jgi:hypothetical protein
VTEALTQVSVDAVASQHRLAAIEHGLGAVKAEAAAARAVADDQSAEYIALRTVTASASPAFELWRPGDGHPRLRITDAGRFYFGDGTSAPTSVSFNFVAASILAVTGELRAVRSTGTNGAFSTSVTGNSATSLLIDALGKISWGGGSGTHDIDLFRRAAGELKTGGKMLTTGGLGVGNSVVATTPGTVTRKIEVFDANGASLGFVPVYNAIT